MNKALKIFFDRDKCDFLALYFQNHQLPIWTAAIWTRGRNSGRAESNFSQCVIFHTVSLNDFTQASIKLGMHEATVSRLSIFLSGEYKTKIIILLGHH